MEPHMFLYRDNSVEAIDLISDKMQIPRQEVIFTMNSLYGLINYLTTLTYVKGKWEEFKF